MTQELADLKNPISQLLAAGSKAEKALKAAVEQLRKQAEKKQSAASKPKKGTTTQPPTAPLFDMGASAATAIDRIAMGAAVNASKPFVVDCSALVSAFLQEGSVCKQQVGAFEASFNTARKTSPGTRVSKLLETNPQLTEMIEKAHAIFNPAQGLVEGSVFPEDFKKQHMLPSLFGIDASYDRVSAEALGMATGRLCLQGTRVVVMTEMMQLQGFMERKGIQNITVAKLSAFFKGMHGPMITEYKKECSLWFSTVAAGDFLYTPYGFLLGELVSQPSLGVRLPLVCKSTANPNAVMALTKRKEEADRLVSASSASGEEQPKQKLEAAALQILLSAVSPQGSG